MKYREPRARVTYIEASRDAFRIKVQLTGKFARPLSPASLIRDDQESITPVELHRLVELDGRTATFESNLTPAPDLKIGSEFVLRCWWGQDQLEIARGIYRPWQRTNFSRKDATRHHWPKGVVALSPRDEARAQEEEEIIKGGWDHEHCRLCWETIDEDSRYGYLDGTDWVCITCYDRYIASGLGAKLGDMV